MTSRRCTTLVLIACALAVATARPTPAQTISTYAIGTIAPIGIAFDPSGNLYATTASGGLGGVWKAPPGGGALTLLYSSAADIDPWGIVCDPSGNVYFADRNPGVANGGRIMKVAPGGVATVFKSGIQAPTGLAMDPSGNLYAGIYNFNKIIKITPGGVVSDYATGIGTAGELLFQLSFDENGNLYVGVQTRMFRISPGGSTVTPILTGLDEAVGHVRWTGDNFIIAQFGFRTLVYASPSRGNPPVDLVNTALADHCQDGLIPLGASAQRPTFMTLRDGYAYFADSGCRAVRRFYLPGLPVGAQKRTWGAVKAHYR